ncbi:hypothetical protein CFAM422_009925 [Trichoderma lentiforme]|uniref:GIY-YIG nuclease family protein n=1 Tax=Trichoderma lentiforme TaxID=1567552 RepID=A0A9P4X6G5_9HYPO|nr:hypothetical protein CFAM422_009925 [Trichoderma lentiforme]
MGIRGVRSMWMLLIGTSALFIRPSWGTRIPFSRSVPVQLSASLTPLPRSSRLPLRRQSAFFRSLRWLLPGEKLWAVYAILYEKPGYPPKLYIGSGTNSTAGVRSRLRNYDLGTAFISRHCFFLFRRRHPATNHSNRTLMLSRSRKKSVGFRRTLSMFRTTSTIPTFR